jgi:hypothetical protein
MVDSAVRWGNGRGEVFSYYTEKIYRDKEKTIDFKCVVFLSQSIYKEFLHDPLNLRFMNGHIILSIQLPEFCRN